MSRRCWESRVGADDIILFMECIDRATLELAKNPDPDAVRYIWRGSDNQYTCSADPTPFYKSHFGTQMIVTKHTIGVHITTEPGYDVNITGPDDANETDEPDEGDDSLDAYAEQPE